MEMSNIDLNPWNASILACPVYGAADLAGESRDILEISMKASGESRVYGFGFTPYQIAARILGWPLAGRFACWVDWFRK